MTVVIDHRTGQVLEVETAEMRASFICTDLDHAASSFETAMDRMRLAISERDDIALGYRSPGDYLSDRFGGRLARLGVDLRREVVRELTEAGMSTRSIAPIVGVDHTTVSRDVQRVASATPQTPEPADGGEASTGSGQTVDESEVRGTTERATDDLASADQPEGGSFPTRTASPASGEGEPEATPARPPVIGIDGKTYSRPEPKLRPSVDEAEWSRQDRAEELARSLSSHLSLLFAVTNPERRAEYIATWRDGIRDLRPLGADFVTPTHMRDLAAALTDFATEWENAHV